METQPKTVLHERVYFEGGRGGDAYALIHEGDDQVYLGIGGSIGPVSQITTMRLSMKDAEALAGLLQKAIVAVKTEINAAPRVCEFCQKPATDERTDKRDDLKDRVMLVCDGCAEDHDRAEKRRRDEDAADCAADQKLSEWKDEGRWR